jgi:hypothetical protein
VDTAPGITVTFRLMKFFPLAFLVICAPAASAAEVHSHPPPEKLGTVTFTISCAQSVARDFELNRAREALQEYRAALVAAPGRRGALTGAAHAADLVGDTQVASQMRAILSN